MGKPKSTDWNLGFDVAKRIEKRKNDLRRGGLNRPMRSCWRPRTSRNRRDRSEFGRQSRRESKRHCRQAIGGSHGGDFAAASVVGGCYCDAFRRLFDGPY